MRNILVIASLLAFAGCAAAPESQTAAVAGGEQKICKRVTPTGSNMPQRICSSASEWAELERIGREGVEDMKRHTDSMGTSVQGQ